MQIIQTRRRFLAGAAMAGAAGVVGLPKSLHAESPPETTTVRLPRWVGGSYCWAGAYIAGELMRRGFTDVRIKAIRRRPIGWIARGDSFRVNFPPNQIVDRCGVPIKVLTGLHSGASDDRQASATSRTCGGRRALMVQQLGRGCPHVRLCGLGPSTISMGPGGDAGAELFVKGRSTHYSDATPAPELRARRLHDPQQCRRPVVCISTA
jgi:hypothetical protein